MPLRTLLLRLVAAVLAVAALVFPGFGIPDLLVTWDPDWQVVLEAGWGLFMTVLVAASLLTVVVAPRRAAPAPVQLWVAAGCVLVAAALGTDAHAAVLGLGLVACAVVVSLPRAGSVGRTSPSGWTTTRCRVRWRSRSWCCRCWPPPGRSGGGT